MIKLVKTNDYSAVHDLILREHKFHVKYRPDLFRDIDPCSKESLDTLLNDKNTISVAAEVDTQIVGICIVTLKKSSCDLLLISRMTAYLEDLYVAEEYRRMRIGKALVLRAREISKFRGAESMELTVWEFHANAVGFYKSLGMTIRSMVMEQQL